MKFIISALIKGGVGTLSVGGVAYASATTYINVQAVEEEKENGSKINVLYDDQHFTKKNELRKYVFGKVVDNLVPSYEKQDFTLSIAGKNMKFDTIDSALDFITNNYTKTKEVYFSKGYENFIDPVTKELHNTAHVAQDSNEELYKIYEKIDGTFSYIRDNVDEAAEKNANDIAAQTYAQVHNGYEYDKIYFKNKADIEAYIRAKVSSSTPNDRHTFESANGTENWHILLGQDGSKQIFDGVNDPAFKNYLINNATPVYVSDDGQSSIDFIYDNLGLISNIVDENKLEYIQIASNGNRIMEYVDIDKRTNNGNLSGPFFLETGQGLASIKNPEKWEFEDYSEQSKDWTADFLEFDIFVNNLMSSIIGDKNDIHENGLFYDYLGSKKFRSELFLRDMSLLEYLSYTNKNVHSRFVNAYNNVSNGKNFKTFNGIIFSYKWIINRMIDEGMSVSTIREVGKMFHEIAGELDKALTDALGEFIYGNNKSEPLNYFKRVFNFEKLNFQNDADSYFRDFQGYQTTEEIWMIYKLIKVYFGIQIHISNEIEKIDSLFGGAHMAAKKRKDIYPVRSNNPSYSYNKLRNDYYKKDHDSYHAVWKHLEIASWIDASRIEIGDLKLNNIITNVNDYVNSVNKLMIEFDKKVNEVIIPRLKSLKLWYTWYWNSDTSAYVRPYDGGPDDFYIKDDDLTFLINYNGASNYIDLNYFATKLPIVPGKPADPTIGFIEWTNKMVEDPVFQAVLETADFIASLLPDKYENIYNGIKLAINLTWNAFVPRTEKKSKTYKVEGNTFTWDGYEISTILFGKKVISENSVDKLKIIDPEKVTSGYASNGYYIGNGRYVISDSNARTDYIMNLHSSIEKNRNSFYETKVDNIRWVLKTVDQSNTSSFSTIKELGEEIKNKYLKAYNHKVHVKSDSTITDDYYEIIEDRVKTLLAKIQPLFIFKKPDVVNGKYTQGAFEYPLPLYDGGTIISEPKAPTASQEAIDSYNEKKSKLLIYDPNVNLKDIDKINQKEMYEFYSALEGKSGESLLQAGYSFAIRNISVRNKVVTFRDLNAADISNTNSFDDINEAPMKSMLFHYIDKYGVRRYFMTSSDLVNYAIRNDQFNLQTTYNVKYKVKGYILDEKVFATKNDAFNYVLKNYSQSGEVDDDVDEYNRIVFDDENTYKYTNINKIYSKSERRY